MWARSAVSLILLCQLSAREARCVALSVELLLWKTACKSSADRCNSARRPRL